MLGDLIGKIIHADCLDVLKKLPDKCVDLVLTDPPYGIGIAACGTVGRSSLAEVTRYPVAHWDNQIPSGDYFMHLKRVGKHCIVWGGNYFAAHLGNSPCWLVWDKVNGENDFADCELAWTDFPSAVRRFSFRWAGMLQGDMANKEQRYHPTQKPVPLFRWCLDKYSKPGDLILDPFAGSGTTALACHALNRRFICIEREAEYVEVARNRLRDLQAQGDLYKDLMHSTQGE